MFTSTTNPQQKPIGAYSPYSGVTVSIEKGAAYDQANRVATHLASILLMMTSSNVDPSIKESLWLVTSLADEIVALLPMVVLDTCQGGL